MSVKGIEGQAGADGMFEDNSGAIVPVAQIVGETVDFASQRGKYRRSSRHKNVEANMHAAPLWPLVAR